MFSQRLGNTIHYFVTNNVSGLTTMKVQKLSYLAYCWYLVCYDKKLFRDDIRAWKNGPVIQDLFQVHKGSRMFKKNMVNGYDSSKLDDEIQLILASILKVYGSMSGDQLSDLTHGKDTPWDRTLISAMISDNDIKAFYLVNYPNLTLLPILKDIDSIEFDYTRKYDVNIFLKNNPTYAHRDLELLKNKSIPHMHLVDDAILTPERIQNLKEAAYEYDTHSRS